MEKEKEVLDPQKNQDEAPKVEISEAELSDLRHKAEVSSQNFERAKKAELALEEKEARLKEIEESSSDVFSEEGKALQGEISALKTELSDVKGELSKKDLLIAHPVIGEKWEEFEKFRSDPENKGMNLRTAAKAFLVENGLLEARRPGLERPTGGPRVPVSSKMSMEDIKTLRTTNHKEYLKKLQSGEIEL